MTVSTAPGVTDRSDFRTVVTGGATIGALTGVAVIAYVLVTRLVDAPPARHTLQALVVLATGFAASLLPAQWTAARNTEGIAGAAATGLCGTVVFSAIDIALLRPLNHLTTIYPWTWDAVGGGSTWWYLPIWWMLGTFLAWMGGILTAAQAARGEPAAGRLGLSVLVGAAGLTVVARLAGIPIALPVAAGGAYTVALTAVALAARARTG